MGISLNKIAVKKYIKITVDLEIDALVATAVLLAECCDPDSLPANVS